MAKKLVIIDGYSLANRAFFALPPLATRNGQPTNAVYGLLMMLLKLLEENKPDYLLTAFDVAAPTFRHQQYREYKAHRLKMEDSLRTQFPIIRELLAILKVPIYEKPGFEADDVIGTFAKKAAKQGLEVEIITGDRDSFQLVEPGIKVLYTKKGISEYDTVTESFIQDRYQLTPQQLIDLKGLMGDSSDNIPGVPGVGEKTALKYLHQYGSLEAVYEHLDEVTRKREQELLATYREQAFLSKQLATIDTAVDLDLEINQCCHHQEFDREKLLEFCREYEFKSLLTKLSGEAPAGEIKKLPEVAFEVATIGAGELPEVVALVRQEAACGVQFLTAVANWHHVECLGLGLCSRERIWFFPLEPKTPLPEPLVELLGDNRILKYGHDLKKQMLIAAGLGIEISGSLEDIMVAGYLVNAGVGSLELEELAVTYLQQTVPVWQNERGNKIGIFDLSAGLPEKVRAQLAGGRLAGIRQLVKEFKTLLTELGVDSLYNEVELPLIRVLFNMERTGIKVDPEVLRTFGGELRERQHQLEAEIYQLTGVEFNIGSPKQLGTILFEKLGLTPPKKNKTGYSTDAAVLESLSAAHPVIPKILEYRQNVKLQTTYIDSLIGLIHPENGRVHTTFNQAVTTTGRLSSTEPNLQNIPIRTEEGRKIRRAFIPGDDSLSLFSADYSQIELRVMAYFSGDAAYREAFLKGEDIHQFTAAAVWGVPLDQVTREMRSQAKAVNFGIIYGISGFGLAQNIGVTRKEADAFIKAYFNKYPGVEAYVEELIAEAKKTGESKTLLGRIRKLPDLTSRNFTLRSFAERTARNTPIQGTAADIIKVAMVRIQKLLAERPELGKLLLQVHDELVFETPVAGWRDLARCVKAEMEKAVELTVPLVVDLKLGSDWGTMEPVKLED
ncbi:MAG TPA: DNA polymerase I [Bacillota bacterium]|nr:DNA polymerase I [Bacillota bacterium]